MAARTPLETETATWLRLQQRAHHEFGQRLAAVQDWEGATPDTEWTVRDLVQHVIEEQQWVPWLLSGLSTRQARSRLEALEGDLTHEWHRYSLAATTAWRGAEPTAEVNLASDTVAVTEYLKEQVADVTIHTWDLARAVGASEELDDELVQMVWTVFAPQRDALETSGLFASPVPITDDAPLLLRLLALTGRDARPQD
ncbi:TIGR03086 family metal-binding protein [Herbiconiux sp. P18]|uniref:TIGR03086 family metal-binding protein n=1 Tax=Herbiconiux liangxiaofengii TaxID=3342795 RepID=UPI0035BAB833